MKCVWGFSGSFIGGGGFGFVCLVGFFRWSVFYSSVEMAVLWWRLPLGGACTNFLPHPCKRAYKNTLERDCRTVTWVLLVRPSPQDTWWLP